MIETSYIHPERRCTLKLMTDMEPDDPVCATFFKVISEFGSSIYKSLSRISATSVGFFSRPVVTGMIDLCLKICSV